MSYEAIAYFALGMGLLTFWALLWLLLARLTRIGQKIKALGNDASDPDQSDEGKDV